MIFPLKPISARLTRDRLAVGLEVISVGPLWPREQFQGGQAQEYPFVPLSSLPRGVIESFTEGSLNEMRVTVANTDGRLTMTMGDLAVASEVIR